MKIAAGIVQALLSVGLGMSGIMKLITPYALLAADPNMAWAADFSPMQVQLIGILEVLGVIGLNLPFLIKSFKRLVPLAATGLGLTMLGAVITHIARGENFVPALALLIMALFVAYARKDLLKGAQGESKLASA